NPRKSARCRSPSRCFTKNSALSASQRVSTVGPRSIGVMWKTERLGEESWVVPLSTVPSRKCATTPFLTDTRLTPSLAREKAVAPGLLAFSCVSGGPRDAWIFGRRPTALEREIVQAQARRDGYYRAALAPSASGTFVVTAGLLAELHLTDALFVIRLVQSLF